MTKQFVVSPGIAENNLVGTDGITLGDIKKAATEALPKNGDVSNNLVLATYATSARRMANFAGDIVNIRDYGVRADGIRIDDGVMAKSSASLSSVSYQFTEADINKRVVIPGASGYGYLVNGTIQSVADGVATLDTTAQSNLTGVSVFFGTDDTAQWNAALNQISASKTGGIYLPPGLSIVTGSINWLGNISLFGRGAGKSIVKYAGKTDMLSAVISALSGSADNPYTDCQFENFEIDCDAAVQSAYNVAGKAFYIQYMRRPVFRGLYIHGSPATGLGCDFMDQGLITGNIVDGCGRLNNGTAYGGAGIGIGVGKMAAESYVTIGNFVSGSGRFGIFYETQTQTPAAQAQAVTIGNFVNLTRLSAWSNVAGAGIADSGLTGHVCSGNFVKCDAGVASCVAVNNGSLGFSGIKGQIVDNHLTGANQTISVSLKYDAISSPINDYVVSGNYIDGSADCGIFIKGNVNFSSGGVTVTGNYIYNTSSSPILLDGDAACTISDVVIKQNKIKNCNTGINTPANTTWHGGAVQVTAPVTCAGLTVSGNDVLCTTPTTTNSSGTQYVLVIAGTVTGLVTRDNTWTGTLYKKPLIVTGSAAWRDSDSFPLVPGVTQIAATGTTLSGAAALYGQYNQVVSATAATAVAVSLPAPMPDGVPVHVVNMSGVDVSVYPDVAANQIGNATAGSPVTLASGAAAVFVKSGTIWLRVS